MLGGSLLPVAASAMEPARGCDILKPGSLPFPARPAGIPQPDLAPELAEIDHIVMVMMENHSFDNYLGMLPHIARYGRRHVDGWPVIGADGIPNAAQADAHGNYYRAFNLDSACQDGGPSNSWDASHISLDGGKMDGFVRASGEAAMRYWSDDILPTYYSLAATFPVCDRYFSSTLCQTYPNRVFAMAATAAGTTSTDTPPPDIIPPNGHIFDLLEHYGISWGCYYTELPTPGLLGKTWAAQREGTHLFGPFGAFNATLAAVEAKIVAGLLENVVMIEEDFQYGSEENPQNIQAGQLFVYNVVRLFMKYPDTWKRTLIIFNYDEHGGYYDHVPPPPALNPGDGTHPNRPASDLYGDDYTTLGFRVPAIVISPWAKENFVSHTIYDHTSVLRTIEAKWNLPALTFRDANANDMRDCLVNNLRERAPFLEPPAIVAAPPSSPTGTAAIDSNYCERVANVQQSFPGPVANPPPQVAPKPVAISSCAPERSGRAVAEGTLSLPFTSAGPGAVGDGAAIVGVALAGLAGLLARRRASVGAGTVAPGQPGPDRDS